MRLKSLLRYLIYQTTRYQTVIFTLKLTLLLWSLNLMITMYSSKLALMNTLYVNTALDGGWMTVMFISCRLTVEYLVNHLKRAS